MSSNAVTFKQIKRESEAEYNLLKIAMRTVLLESLRILNAKDLSNADITYCVDFIADEYGRHCYENWLTFNYLLRKGTFKFYPTPSIGALNAAYLEYMQGSDKFGVGCDYEFAKARNDYAQDKPYEQILALRALDI